MVFYHEMEPLETVQYDNKDNEVLSGDWALS